MPEMNRVSQPPLKRGKTNKESLKITNEGSSLNQRDLSFTTGGSPWAKTMVGGRNAKIKSGKGRPL